MLLGTDRDMRNGMQWPARSAQTYIVLWITRRMLSKCNLAGLKPNTASNDNTLCDLIPTLCCSSAIRPESGKIHDSPWAA